MLIKPILVGVSIILMFYFLVAARDKPVQKIMMAGVFLLVAFFVIFPDTSTRIAHLVGVGRGVDLVLYISTFVLLCICFNLYLQLKRLEDAITKLARELALSRTSPKS